MENNEQNNAQNQGTEGTSEKQTQGGITVEQMSDIMEKKMTKFFNSIANANGYDTEEKRKQFREEFDKKRNEEQDKKDKEFEALKQRSASMEKQLLDMNMNKAAASVAEEIGINPKRLGKAMKLADMDGVVSDGVIDNEKLKAALQTVLDDIPEFGISEGGTGGGVKRVGAHDEGNSQTDADAKMRKAFGLPEKK